MPYRMMDGTHHMFMGYGWIFQLLIIALLILIFWWLLKGQGFGYAKSGTPLEIVQRRYAAGEITKKEYERLKKELGESDGR